MPRTTIAAAAVALQPERPAVGAEELGRLLAARGPAHSTQPTGAVVWEFGLDRQFPRRGNGPRASETTRGLRRPGPELGATHPEAGHLCAR
jgi:hypothetical protein